MALQLYELVRAVPFGKCATYGTLGQLLPHRVSGLTIGRWMANAPPDIPWHRVVAKDGSLPIAKKDPVLAQKQEHLLRLEKVPFDSEGRVLLAECKFDPDA